MPWVRVFLGLFLLGRPSGFLDDTSAREDCLIVHVAEPEGSSVNTSIPNASSISETSFFVQKYNTSSSWEDVIYSSNEGSQTVLSSFKETLSFSGGYFKMENVSKGAEGVYRIQDEMYRKCVAVVNFTVVEPASWSRLLVLGVMAVVGVVGVVGVLVSLYLCGFWKGRGKAFAYSQLVFWKVLTHPSPQPGSPQDSQESELPAVCDRDGDQAQGTRNRNRDPALENGEGDLLMEDRRFTLEPRERGPLGGDTGVAQETGVALPVLQDDRESAGIKD
ncbi:uncharacterized protein [Lepidochelys kempii]|uniref:uncharacterized protein isoform X1 n=1 Tax=Lepidochelys kempii TaxID=8472 RepID=UPI003C6FD4B6